MPHLCAELRVVALGTCVGQLTWTRLFPQPCRTRSLARPRSTTFLPRRPSTTSSRHTFSRDNPILPAGRFRPRAARYVARSHSRILSSSLSTELLLHDLECHIGTTAPRAVRTDTTRRSIIQDNCCASIQGLENVVEEDRRVDSRMDQGV